MQTLKLNEDTARKIYPNSSPEFKVLLEESFPKGFFFKNIIERTNSIDDIFSIAGKTILEIINSNDTKDESAYKVLKFGIAVLNEEWIPDYTNPNQSKYEPRFILGANSILKYYSYNILTKTAIINSHLVYRSYDHMMHGIRIMHEFYNDFIRINK